MKKWIPLILIVVAIFGAITWGVGKSNEMVELNGQALKQWSKVQSAYQRRNDLIKNLVKTVQGAADFERGTLREVIEARAKATSVTIDASNLNAETMAQFQKAQSGLNSALSRLLVTVERYPELKANRNFLELQSQLEGTENRINVERNRYNDIAGDYNIFIRKIPNNFVANISGHSPMFLFEAEKGAQKAPEVDFDFK